MTTADGTDDDAGSAGAVLVAIMEGGLDVWRAWGATDIEIDTWHIAGIGAARRGILGGRP